MLEHWYLGWRKPYCTVPQNLTHICRLLKKNSLGGYVKDSGLAWSGVNGYFSFPLQYTIWAEETTKCYCTLQYIRKSGLFSASVSDDSLSFSGLVHRVSLKPSEVPRVPSALPSEMGIFLLAFCCCCCFSSWFGLLVFVMEHVAQMPIMRKIY